MAVRCRHGLKTREAHVYWKDGNTSNEYKVFRHAFAKNTTLCKSNLHKVKAIRQSYSFLLLNL